MNVTSRNDAHVSIVEIDGKMSHESIHAVREQFDRLRDHGSTRVVFDLSRVPTVDSSGLGVLIHAHVTLQRDGGKAVLVNPQGPVKETLRTTRLDTVIEVYATTERALRSFQ